MRTFFISDLHYGTGSECDAAVRALSRHVNEEGKKDDALVIVGDIAVDDRSLSECLSLFSAFRGRKAAVAGNHDVWTTGDPLDRYRRLPSLFRSAGFHPLDEEPMAVGRVGFAGVMGWHDRTFRDPSLGIAESAYREKRYPEDDRVLWNDALYARWSAGDDEIAAWQAALLDAHVRALRGVREVVLAVHHVPTTALLVHPRWMVPRMWRFMNAFLGSERLGEVARKHADRVRLIVNGHIHMARQASAAGQVFVSIGGGDHRKQLLVREGDAIRRMTFSA
jgi:3',5'-cyclic AMP phosphodiesterase CpdA